MNINSFIKKVTVFILATSIAVGFYSTGLAQVDEEAIRKYEEEIAAQEAAKKEKESILSETQKQIDSIKASGSSVDSQIYQIESLISNLTGDIDNRTKEIEKRATQIVVKESEIDKVRESLKKQVQQLYYISRITDIENFIMYDDLSEVFRLFMYRKAHVDKISSDIGVIQSELEQIRKDKESLEKDRKRLEVQKEAYNISKNNLYEEKARIIAELNRQKSLESSLNNDLSQIYNNLNNLQKQLIIAKSGAYVVDANSVPATGDFNATLQGFRQNAPNGSFAVFSFGAYTHRNGMSQWGALARARSGQSVEQILSDYYPKSSINKSYPTPDRINVSGYGNLSFEDEYLLGIYEMPESWPLEVLKAQAIAARTYAVRYLQSNSTICTTEACQVFRYPLKSGNWAEAVRQTRGWVLIDGNGSPRLTEYASSHGGWVNGIGWDTTDGSGGNSGWTAKAWETLAGHPWFYRSWYRNGYSDSSATCGHMPWFSEEAMADFINIYLIRSGADVKDSYDSSRVLPVDGRTCHGYGTTPYSYAEIRALMNNPVVSITGYPRMVISNGHTDYVTFSTNRGDISISGDDFKATFNLRAHGYLAIPQWGFTFFNIERK